MSPRTRKSLTFLFAVAVVLLMAAASIVAGESVARVTLGALGAVLLLLLVALES